MQNKLGKKEITAEQYTNMGKIYEHFKCKNMSNLLHIYTLENGMLLVIIMSDTFRDIHEALALDPSNFASTAKYSHIAYKGLMNLKMQTIPNGRVFNCITEMKRAGFSMVKKQVSVASPLNEHVWKCQYSLDCKIWALVKVFQNDRDLQEIRDEVNCVTIECKEKLKKIQEARIAWRYERNRFWRQIWSRWGCRPVGTLLRKFEKSWKRVPTRRSKIVKKV